MQYEKVKVSFCVSIVFSIVFLGTIGTSSCDGILIIIVTSMSFSDKPASSWVSLNAVTQSDSPGSTWPGKRESYLKIRWSSNLWCRLYDIFIRYDLGEMKFNKPNILDTYDTFWRSPVVFTIWCLKHKKLYHLIYVSKYY